MPVPVLWASPNPTSPVHRSSPLAEPVAVHPSSEQPLAPGADHVGLGASRALPVVPLPVTVPHATSGRRTLPLTAAAGPAMPAALSANSAADELGGASTRVVTETVKDARPSLQPGGATGGPPYSAPLRSPPPAPPVDVDAIAATVQRRVLRRFELEAERRGARR